MEYCCRRLPVVRYGNCWRTLSPDVAFPRFRDVLAYGLLCRVQAALKQRRSPRPSRVNPRANIQHQPEHQDVRPTLSLSLSLPLSSIRTVKPHPIYRYSSGAFTPTYPRIYATPRYFTKYIHRFDMYIHMLCLNCQTRRTSCIHCGSRTGCAMRGSMYMLQKIRDRKLLATIFIQCILCRPTSIRVQT